MNDAAIQMQGVTKVFGSQTAVDGLGLTVPRGSVLGFVGPNGAGKTTTIRMIVGHLHPTGGTVRTLGRDPWLHDEATRRRVAYVSENMALPGWLTPLTAIRLCAPLYRGWDGKLAESLLDEFGLRSKDAFSTLSKGQKRALCILLALCQKADLLVMDEPAAGLDPMARRDFLERILEVACDGGRTVFMSSHILSDLERVVDRVAVVCGGCLSLDCELDQLKREARRLHLPRQVNPDVLGVAFKVLRCGSRDDETEAVVLGFDEDRFRAFCKEQHCAAGARHYGMNLEDVFVEITQSKTADQAGA
jgi:ABC-2 type transport system ATP-binding protein